MICLYTPKIDELSFRQSLLADEATMAYNAEWGGALSFPRENWEGWYDRWVKNAAGKRFYAYLYSEEEKGFVGEAACHWDEESGRYMLDVIVHDRFRGKGYGTQGLMLLCEKCCEMGCGEVYDHIALGNESVRLFLKNGFREVSRDQEGVWVQKEL